MNFNRTGLYYAVKLPSWGKLESRQIMTLIELTLTVGWGGWGF